MAIEIRNLRPSSGEGGVSVNGNITFDIVATDQDQIDINTLQVQIDTVSKVDGSTNSITYGVIPLGYSYGYNDPNVCGEEPDFYRSIASAIMFTGSCIHYIVTIDPSQPFELGQNVTITIRVSDTDGNAMTPLVSTFGTMPVNVISEFELIFLDQAQKIPVYHERMRKEDSDTSPRIYTAFCGPWLKKPKPIVRYNRVIVDQQGTSFSPSFNIDYTNGKVSFNEALDVNDIIDVSYHLRFFNDDQIKMFLQQATSLWRISPQFGGPTTIYQADLTTRTLIYIGAATFAYRALLSSLAYQEKRLIFDNHSWEDGWRQTMDLFRGLLDSYEKAWENALEGKSIRLPSIRSVITPEFTLPGGRSRMFRFLYKNGFGGG